MRIAGSVIWKLKNVIVGGKRRPCDSKRGGMSARVLDDGAGLPAKVTISLQMTYWWM